MNTVGLNDNQKDYITSFHVMWDAIEGQLDAETTNDRHL